jgi:PilZ domain
MKDKLEQTDEGTPEPVAVAERRRARRYILSASAEVSEVDSGARLAARVGDISITGYYLDSINAFPDGTRLRLHIRRDGVEFNGEGTVRYVKFGLGMGLAFLHLDDGQKGVLRGWIERLDTSASLDVPPVVLRTSAESHAASSLEISGSKSNDALVLRLIERLQEKDLLSLDDVAALLKVDIL